MRHVTIADCVVRVVGSWVIEDRPTGVFFCPRPINWSNCRLSTCILIKCALIKCILNSCKIHRTQWTKMDADEDSVGPQLRLASLFHSPRLKIHCSDYAIIYDFTYLGSSCLYLPGTSWLTKSAVYHSGLALTSLTIFYHLQCIGNICRKFSLRFDFNMSSLILCDSIFICRRFSLSSFSLYCSSHSRFSLILLSKTSFAFSPSAVFFLKLFPFTCFLSFLARFL